MRLTAQEIEQMKSVDIGAVDKETLADASGFTFDPMLPKETRAQRMLEHFKNPYCFRLGDMVIKLEFADDGPSLQELLTAFFLRQKSGLYARKLGREIIVIDPLTRSVTHEGGGA